MTAFDTLYLDAVERAVLTERAKWLHDPFIPRASIMAPDTYLDRLRARLRDFTREHGVLGQFHDDRLFDELNELERMIGDELRWIARTLEPSPWWHSLFRAPPASFVMEVVL